MDLTSTVEFHRHIDGYAYGDHETTPIPTGLSMMSARIASIPPSIGGLGGGLIQLYLSDNEIAELPSEIGMLIHLERFDINKNLLTSLPPEIGKLTSLTNLNISDNTISVLPPEIGNLSLLRDLYMNFNCLAYLPDEICRLVSLKNFGAANNNLHSLPEEFGKFEHLKRVFLDCNLFSQFPLQLCKLESLNELSINYNNILDLPDEFQNIRAWLIHIYGARFKINPRITQILCNMKRCRNLSIGTCVSSCESEYGICFPSKVIAQQMWYVCMLYKLWMRLVMQKYYYRWRCIVIDRRKYCNDSHEIYIVTRYCTW